MLQSITVSDVYMYMYWKLADMYLQPPIPAKNRPLYYFTLSNSRQFYLSRESLWVGKVKGLIFEKLFC